MKITILFALGIASSAALAAEPPIDRHALVTRHNIRKIVPSPSDRGYKESRISCLFHHYDK